MNRKEELEWFSKKDYQSELKHHVLQQYLLPWANIVKQTDTYFFDCFAGAGIYDDNKPGSPVIAAQILLDIQNKYNARTPQRPVNFHIRNFERNTEVFKKLVSSLQKFQNQIDIENYNGSFHELLPTFLSQFNRNNYDVPMLFFIDPFGYLDADPQIILKIMERSKREVLINLMSYSLVRASGIDDDTYRTGVERILGKVDFDNTEGEVEQKVLEKYIQQFRSAGYLVSSVRIQNPEVPQIYFHLVHITKHTRGLKEMKHAIRENIKKQKIDKKDREGQLTLSIFEEYDSSLSMAEYKQQLIDTYFDKNEVRYIDLITKELQKSDFDYGEIKQALKELAQEGLLRITGGSENYNNQDPHTIIKFLREKQLSLF